MSQRRVARLNEQLKREITEILRYEVKDPRVGTATVTEVSVAPDLSFARVYIGALGEEPDKAEAVAGVRAAAAFIRGELGRRLRLRRLPELDVQLDRAAEHATRIERLLNEVRQTKAEPGDEPATDEENAPDER